MDQQVRPIDANALKKRAIKMEIFMPYGGDGTTMAVEVDAIESAPTLDYAPVRYGEWLFVESMENDYETEIAERCSLCGRFVYRYQGVPQDNYCPNCGALMDAKEENNEQSHHL